MALNPFDPIQFGFTIGSPIFDYPPRAKKLVNEATVRIQGSSNYVQCWERMLTPDERKQFDDDVDKCVERHSSCLDLLCKLRSSWTRERTVVEIAYLFGYMSPQNYQWICQLDGDSIPDRNVVPNWNRKTGRLEFDGRICREIKVVKRAKKIVPVLDKFQEAGWPSDIEYVSQSLDDQEIHQACRNLNSDLSHISFHVDTPNILWRVTDG